MRLEGNILIAAPPPNNTLQPTSLPSVACFNLRQQVVGSAAAERGRWAALSHFAGPESEIS